MTDIQDSSGLPTTGSGKGKRVTLDTLKHWIDLASQKNTEHLLERVQVLEASLNTLDDKISRILDHIQKLDDHATQVHSEYIEMRDRADEIEQMIIGAESSVQYVRRTVERMNQYGESTSILLEILVPVRNWLDRWICSQQKIDQRISTVDGQYTPLPPHNRL